MKIPRKRIVSVQDLFRFQRTKTHLHLQHLPVFVPRTSVKVTEPLLSEVRTTALPKINTSTFGATAHSRLPNSKIKMANNRTLFARAIVRTCEYHKVNGAWVKKKADPIHPMS